MNYENKKIQDKNSNQDKISDDLSNQKFSQNEKDFQNKENYKTINEYNVEEPCCNHPLIKEENGFFVCQNCGMVHEEQVFDNTPRRAFTPEEIEKRKSTEPVHSKIGPRTVIRGSTDAKGVMLSPKLQQKFRHLSKIHRSLTTSYERNLWIALPNLQRLQERLNLSDTISEDALRIYTHSVKKKLTMGRSIDALLSASIYAALKIHGQPRPIEDIESVSLIPKKNILKSYRLIWQKVLPEMNLKVSNLNASDYVNKFIQELNLNMDVRNLSLEFLKMAENMKFPMAGKDPKGLAAAAIYLACKKLEIGVTQLDIAKTAHVTEVTLRMRAKELRKYIININTPKKSTQNNLK